MVSPKPLTKREKEAKKAEARKRAYEWSKTLRPSISSPVPSPSVNTKQTLMVQEKYVTKVAEEHEIVSTTPRVSTTSRVSSAPPGVKVFITSGPHKGAEFLLQPKPGAPCFVGRSKAKEFTDNGISLHKDVLVSECHGEILAEDGFNSASEAGRETKLYFVDVGSANGTTMYEDKVEPESMVLLVDGLELKVGKSTMKFIVLVPTKLSSSACSTNIEQTLQECYFAEGSTKNSPSYPVPHSEMLDSPSQINLKCAEGRMEDYSFFPSPRAIIRNDMSPSVRHTKLAPPAENASEDRKTSFSSNAQTAIDSHGFANGLESEGKGNKKVFTFCTFCCAAVVVLAVYYRNVAEDVLNELLDGLV